MNSIRFGFVQIFYVGFLCFCFLLPKGGISQLEEAINVTIIQEVNEDNLEQPEPVDKIEENQGFPETIIIGDGAVLSEVINNDTPIVLPTIDATNEELEKLVTVVPLESTNITKNESQQQEMPSFVEWTEQQLKEEKKQENVSISVNTTKKIRWKNYAAVDCGAKVILANPEAQHIWAILDNSKDEYVLNTCNSRVWFIVELCEAIQLKRVDLANYELFSSSPQDFVVSVSDRFPTRDWGIVGQFTAKDERDVQTFDVDTENFGKYVKVEIKTHYGSEHYCPLSLFRAYGTSVFEVLQKDDPAHEHDDDDDDVDAEDLLKEGKTDLLSSATDAVLSMVKKAAQVLGNRNNKTQQSSTTASEIVKSCTSPSHYVVCNSCSDNLFGKIYELLSCRQKYVRNLVSIPFISNKLESSCLCNKFGLEKTNQSDNLNYIGSFFPESFIGAMCNVLAITHGKVLYNVSHQFPNSTVKEEIPIEIEQNNNQSVDNLMGVVKSGCLTDTSHVGNQKPVQKVATDLPTNDLDTSVEETSEEVPEELLIEEEVELTPSEAIFVPPTGQKESVFLRLSNRIKVLEKNMSLSGQYLEELSKRYKKQVEEMQRVLEKTEKTLQEVTETEDERYRALEEKLESLTKSMEDLASEKENWKTTAYWLFFSMFCIFLVWFYKRVTPTKSTPPSKNPTKIQRRNSVDVVTNNKKKKKRRPSDQALKIVTEYKKRKKKSNTDWPENHSEYIEDIPFPLEEPDSSTTTIIDPPDYIQTAASARSAREPSKKGFKKLLKKMF